MAVGAVERAAAAAGPVCGLHRYDADDLPTGDLCGLRPGHDGDCGHWTRDTAVVCPCGGTESDHLRGWMRFRPDCRAWPPED